MERTVADVIATVVRHVDHLRATAEAPPDEGWLRGDQLARGGEPLRELIERIGTDRGAREPEVAASLFSLSYAFQVGAVPLAAHVLGLPVPDVRPQVTAVPIDPAHPTTVALLAPECTMQDDAELAGRLLGDHLAPLFDAIRREVKIGRRLLWGNAAAALARAGRAAESAGGVDRTAVRRRTEAFFTAAQPWLDGLGRFDVVTVGARDGWFWTRSNCCLWYRASGGSMCDDCSLRGSDVLLASRRAELGSPTVPP